MFVPGILSIIMGLVLINRLRNVPRTLGLPTVEEYKEKKLTVSIEPGSNKHSFLAVREILFNQVLNNKYVWIFSIAYFFVYVVRTAINDWTVFYLMEVKNMEHLAASNGVFWFEMGGFLGMIAAGWGSDYFCKGNRVPSVVLCALGLTISLIAIRYVPPNHYYLDMIVLALIGVFVFGPQMIVGLAAAEFVDKRATATSNGFAGTFGYFGAAFAGYPLGLIIDQWAWEGFFVAIIISSAVIFMMLLPLWSGSKESKKEDQKLPWDPKREKSKTKVIARA